MRLLNMNVKQVRYDLYSNWELSGHFTLMELSKELINIIFKFQ